MATYQELVAQKAAIDKQQADLEKQIAEALRTERAGVIHQIRTLMAEHGIELTDLGVRPVKVTGGKSAAAGRKVAAKYRNAATGDAWSGRGLQPKWLRAALLDGKTLEEFAV